MDAIARRQHGLITRRQAKDLGMSDHAIAHRVASGSWRRVARGVYRFAGVPVTERADLLARVLSVGGGAVACRTTAAALFGLPGFTLAPFHALVPIDAQSRVPGIRVHRTKRLGQTSVTSMDGIPVTSIRRTLFDLCGCVRFERAERAVDHALARRLVTPSDLGEVFAVLARRGRLGTAGMRALLDERGVLEVAMAESELERRFLRLCTDAGLPRPELQVDLGSAEGWIGRVDCLFREARLVVELDGAVHHSTLVDRRADAARDARLRSAGFRALRFTWNDVVGHPYDVVVRLADHLSRLPAPNSVHFERP